MYCCNNGKAAYIDIESVRERMPGLCGLREAYWNVQRKIVTVERLLAWRS